MFDRLLDGHWPHNVISTKCWVPGRSCCPCVEWQTPRFDTRRRVHGRNDHQRYSRDPQEMSALMPDIRHGGRNLSRWSCTPCRQADDLRRMWHKHPQSAILQVLLPPCVCSSSTGQSCTPVKKTCRFDYRREPSRWQLRFRRSRARHRSQGIHASSQSPPHLSWTGDDCTFRLC